ncbi:PKD domain-containing protein [Mesobacillus maritimus]|uniref:IPT/TIG domain protein n=1 Tax=Mesobacillus maritimus TaxID=1643336 RepID=A0ABS7K8I6_9BACI|nr:IPT/TIG domain protein [Mesobacillus maritimus]MBY0098577.1 IPT/TIG domain protein [Mesobacillus maritimus]
MEVGPINALHGFPEWYRDENGLRLQLNVDPNDPYSGITPADLPNPAQPVSFPDNFPGEAFYYAAEAEMETGTGERARLVLALEAAFVNEVPLRGEQIVFGRIRIRVEGLQPNAEYTVTHPYGVNTFTAEPDGDGLGEINFTEDIGGFNGGDFELALNSKVHPFLQWDPTVGPVAPVGYIGDPNVLHPVVGSVFIDRFGEPQNIFRIEGPGIGIGSPDRATTPGIDGDNCIETRNFALLGKISPISGVEVTRASYTQTDTSGGFIDVFAVSDVSPQEIEVTGIGMQPTILQGENGLYFGRIAYIGETPPPSIIIANITDNPPSIHEVVPVDFISATVKYHTDSETLSIEATTSDTIHPIVLSIANFGQGDIPLPSTGLFTMNLTSVPASVTIVSSAGGEVTIPVVVSGSGEGPIPVSADAGADQIVLFGTQVLLDGSNSTGIITSYNWTQLSGPEVNLINPNTSEASFTAPSITSTLVFQLTVEGEGGPSTDTVTVEVIESAAGPIANAGANQTVQQGTLVTLSGTAEGEVTSYRWEQISGPLVQLTNPDSPTATFTFPTQLGTLVFQLTVQGPGGTSTDRTEITTVADNLTVTRAEFRTGDTEWRISGTSDVPGAGVEITIFIGNTLSGMILAVVPVDALGDWAYRFEPSSVQPDATRAISIQSSSGGTLLAIPLNIRQ